MKLSDFFSFCLLVLSCLFSCSSLNDIEYDEACIASDNEPGVFQLGVISKEALGFENYCIFQGQKRVGEGVAIHNNVLYRLYDTGVCETYDISDLTTPVPISMFRLGSYGSSNHCNCAQFVEIEGSLYLYIAGLKGKCYVEELTKYSAKLIQTISLRKLSCLQNSQRLNIISGDDGYLWLFGSDDKGGELVFAKAKRPPIKNKEAVISRDDILDYWVESDYIYKESVWQGGKVNNGYLFFVFGSQGSKSHLAVYNTSTHKKVNDFDLDSVIDEEPEDCDFIGDQILLAIYGGEGYYLIDLENSGQ